MHHAFGTVAATNSLSDIERAHLLFLAGSNATASHPIISARIEQAVLAGTRQRRPPGLDHEKPCHPHDGVNGSRASEVRGSTADAHSRM